MTFLPKKFATPRKINMISAQIFVATDILNIYFNMQTYVGPRFVSEHNEKEKRGSELWN